MAAMAEERHQAPVEVALSYAHAGYPVFPCRPRTETVNGRLLKDKSPYTQHGFRDASTDEKTIRTWWEQWPDAMIGLPTGDGLCVVDLDVDRDTGEPVGAESAKSLGWSELLRSGLHARTPSGGWHAYFSGDLPCNSEKIGPKIDTRGTGGYVVAPGSVNGVGSYAWKGRSLLDGPPPALPAEIHDAAWAARQGQTVEANDNVLNIDTGKTFRGHSCDDEPPLAEIEDALSFIDPDVSYDDWISVLMALHAHLGAAGLELADRWSRGGRKYQPGCVADRWRGFTSGGGTTIRTVFSLAQQHGADLGELARRHRPSGAEGGRSQQDRRGEGADGSGAPGDSGAKAERLSRFRSAAELMGKPIPPREWFVDELIPHRQVTMLGGDGGTGKSLLALQLAVAGATARPWIGRQIEKPGRVVFVSAEDGEDELHRRLADIASAESLSLSQLGNLTYRSLAGEDALLARLDRQSNVLVQTPLFAELDAWIAENAPRLVVLDTLADLHSGEENNRAHARQFVGFLRGLAIRHACTVLLLSHPSLTGMSSGSGLSGSTAWNASVRSRLYLERVADDGHEPDPDARRLTGKKANYARTGQEIGLTWKEGVFVPDRPAGGLDRMAACAKAERVFLKLLTLFTEQGRYVSASPSTTFAPAMFAAHPDAEGCSKRALTQAMEALFSRGKIRNGDHGRPGRERRHIEFAEGSA